MLTKLIHKEEIASMFQKETKEKLDKRMLDLGVFENDLLEKFILGSGKGGQKINKTSSCVYLKHLPSGIEIKCQQDRSREMNRFFARRELCDRIESRLKGEESAQQQAIEKIRRQKRRRSKRAQAKLVEQKRHHGEIKQLRAIHANGSD